VKNPRFWIEDSSDSKGAPLFKLMLDVSNVAPQSRHDMKVTSDSVAVREEHSRPRLERLLRRIETGA